MIWEIGKDYLKKVYNNDIEEAIKQADGMFWTDEWIRKVFKRGNGTYADLKRYMENNKKYCIFVNIVLEEEEQPSNVKRI